MRLLKALLVTSCFFLAALLIVYFTMIVVGCTTNSPRQFNSDDTQDQACYSKYGGQYGYCDATDEKEAIKTKYKRCINETMNVELAFDLTKMISFYRTDNLTPAMINAYIWSELLNCMVPGGTNFANH